MAHSISGRRGRLRLLASSSLTALLIGVGMPSAWAACTAVGTPGVDNTGSVSGFCVTDTSFTGSITNEGTIGSSGISLTNGTITGQISSTGVINGNISIDSHSKITATSFPHSVAIQITGPTFTGNISNAGVISAGVGIQVGSLSGPAISSVPGSISNSGSITAGATGIAVLNIVNFSGGIGNSGSIAASRTGILVRGVTSFSGGISNGGLITAGNGIVVNGFGTTTFSGGISNSGTISVGGIGIDVFNTSTFSGGISNSGTISTTNGNNGIEVSSVVTFSGGIRNSGTIIGASGGIGAGIFVTASPTGAFSASSFGGGISNSGTISANNGIFVQNISTFTGGISNSGMISAGRTGILVSGTGTPSFFGGINNTGTITAGTVGIGVENISLFGSSSAGGGISNGGTISAATGILVRNVSSFYGGISNSGTISSGGSHNAIVVGNVSNFSGGINNSGMISGNDGLNLFTISTFSGGISNSGMISGSFEGIALTSVSTFTGGITNSGSISGAFGGIVATNMTSFGGGISNSGTISSSNRTGIYLNGIGSFSGAISNASGGTISAAVGIRVSSISTFGSTSIGGGITNAGTISAGSVGIAIQNGTTTFLGGISNSGMISAGKTGISVSSVSSFFGGISNSGTISGGASGVGISVSSLSSFSGGISNSGMILEKTGILVTGGNFGSTSGGGITNLGTISGGAVAIELFFVSNFSGGISNSGRITAGSAGIFVSSGDQFSGGISNSGTISASFGIAVTASYNSGMTFSGNISNSGTISAATGILIGPGVTFAPGSAVVNSGTIIGSTAAIDASQATSPVTIDQMGGLISGDIKLSQNADVLNISGGVVNGSIIGAGSSNTVNFTLGSGTYGGNPAYAITGINALNINSGTIILDAVSNSATHVTVNDGLLQVGDAANTGAFLTTSTVNVAGGTLSGHGTVVGNVAVGNGGTLMPGGSIGTLTINGNLVMSSGSFYTIELSPTQHSQTNVTGTVSLNGGTVVLAPQLGAYNTNKIAILTSGGALSGTFNPTLTYSSTLNINGAALSYDGHDVFLSYGEAAAPPPRLFVTLAVQPNESLNAQNVTGGINKFILAGNDLPDGFQALGNLSGNALNNAVGQLAGQTQGSFAPVGFNAGNQFLNLMLNPYIDGRDAPVGAAPVPLAYADEPATSPAASAFSALALAPHTLFEPRLSIWASAYGGAGTISGSATTGAATTASQVYGFATGVDYQALPNTTFGLALGGGGTAWQLGQGLGNGHSGMFQAGVYGTTHFGQAYVAGAAAYSLQDVTTTRNVTVAGFDALQGDFTANVLSTRLEGGYHLPYGLVTITPYAAVQTQAMFLPSYGEFAKTGSSEFALSYPNHTFTDTRTELGAWVDSDSLGLPWIDKGLRLYGRAAWAHDFDNDGLSTAFFQSLTGTSFLVNSVKPAHDGALATAGFEYRLVDGWSVLGRFDGEYSATTTIFAGTGTLRKVW